MVTLIETANIPAPFEKLDAWVDNFEEELEEWITEADDAFKKFGPK